MTKKLQYGMIASAIVLTVIGLIIWGIVGIWNKPENEITLTIEGETITTLEARLAGIYPGGEKEYQVNLTGDEAAEYYIVMNFRDDDGGELKKYLEVTVKAGEEERQGTLEEILSGEKITLGKGIKEITITYRMPESVGNESQGTEVSFYIDVEASNAEEV